MKNTITIQTIQEIEKEIDAKIMKNTMTLQEIEKEIGHAMINIEALIINTEFDKKLKPHLSKVNYALYQLWLYELEQIKAKEAAVEK